MSDYPIPEGWRRVTRGRTRKGDKSWYWVTGWQVKAAGLLVDDYLCIIRRVTAKETR